MFTYKIGKKSESLRIHFVGKKTGSMLLLDSGGDGNCLYEGQIGSTYKTTVRYNLWPAIPLSVIYPTKTFAQVWNNLCNTAAPFLIAKTENFPNVHQHGTDPISTQHVRDL